ncbi:MAG: peroxidase-related enzyme [Pseudomonadota bacterium]|nr:peroxidase-related enzyme [Pseudomonadota bacterium]
MANNKKIIDLKIPLPQTKELPEALQKYFSVCEDKIGFIPNVLKAFSHESSQLEFFSKMYNAIMFAETGLTPLEREMIAVVVSSKNHCFYCLTAHGQAVREYSKDPVLGEQLAMNHKSVELSSKHTKMLEFAEKLTLNPADISGNDRVTLRDAGFSEKEIWDISLVASFFNMTNRLSSATDMQPNSEYHFKDRKEPDT